MVGGDEAAWSVHGRLLELFSAKIFYMGACGAGHTTKLLNNFLNAITLSATAEVMVAGKKAGLDLRGLLDVINNSSGVNFASLNRFPKIIKGDYLEGRAHQRPDDEGRAGLRRARRGRSASPASTPRRRSRASAWPTPSATPSRSATAWSTPSAMSPAACACDDPESRAPTTAKRGRRSASIINGRSGQPGGRAGSSSGTTFTGDVWPTRYCPQDGITINTVIFTPGARTYWHHHEHGQILQVLTAGAWCAPRASDPRVISAGDTVWVPAGGTALARRVPRLVHDAHGDLAGQDPLGQRSGRGRLPRTRSEPREERRTPVTADRPTPRPTRNDRFGPGTDRHARRDVRARPGGAQGGPRRRARASARSAAVTEFSRPVQELVTEYCWGAVWTRDGLDRAPAA